jgi:predicted O-methyltransferase YrrM
MELKHRYDLINALIEKNGYKSYLEIGLDNPNLNYNYINCEHKVSVDPFENDEGFETNRKIPEELTNRETSDDFFAHNTEKFDIIFIDGLHVEEQVGRDIINSLKCLNKGGVILVHDTLPWTEEMQKVPREEAFWTGDVWKAVSELYKQNIDYVSIDFETGISIINYNEKSELLEYPEPSKLTYDGYCNYKYHIMHIIHFNDFLKFYL